MDISFGWMEWLSQAERPQRAQPLDLLLPGKKRLYPCCLETRDSVLLRNLLSFCCHFLLSGVASHFFLVSGFSFTCLFVSLHPPIHVPSLSLILYWFFWYKQRVSRTTDASALRFCDTPANLSPTEVLVAWRNHLYPNRLQIGEAVVFCCVLLFFLHRDLLLSNAAWVPSSGSRLQGFTTLFKHLLLVHCRKRNGWEDKRDKMDTGDYISLMSLRSPWPLIIIQLWFLQRCVFEKKSAFLSW